MDTKPLENIGLTAFESKVYVALVELGSASASQIIQKTGLHRAVVYDLLERLIEKGLVGHVIKTRKKFFEASDPRRLMEIVKEKEQGISVLMPQLLELSKFGSALEVRIYKGKEGMKTVFEDILRGKPREWLVMGSGGETFQLIPAYLAQFQERRAKLGIHLRGLMLDSDKAKKRGKELVQQQHTQIRFLPKQFKTPSVINIYNDRVTLFSVTGENIPFIILIENRELMKSFKEYFEWLWSISS
ncbi:MAG: helix-turn-helix domain-containing protein [archaeon]